VRRKFKRFFILSAERFQTFLSFNPDPPFSNSLKSKVWVYVSALLRFNQIEVRHKGDNLPLVIQESDYSSQLFYCPKCIYMIRSENYRLTNVSSTVLPLAKIFDLVGTTLKPTRFALRSRRRFFWSYAEDVNFWSCHATELVANFTNSNYDSNKLGLAFLAGAKLFFKKTVNEIVNN